MSDVTEEIKSRLDIVDFIQSYVTLKKAGNNWKGLCPFHTEKTPSFMVSAEKQFYKCFGCGESGDIFSFLEKMEGLVFSEALELLANRAGVLLPQKVSTASQGLAAQGPISKNRLYEVNQQSARFFHAILIRHPLGRLALEYVKNRNVNEQSIKKYLLGLAPSRSILQSWLTKQGYSVNEIKSAGSPERFFNRLMFPLHDVMGNIIGFSGRALKKEQEPKYLHTAQTSLFHKSRYLYGLHQAKQAIRSTQSVVIVEGQMDVILSAQAGVLQVVAPSGTALTDDQVRLLGRYTDTFLLGFDQDQAGYKATEEAAKRIIGQGFTAKIISIPPSFKDPAEVAGVEPVRWRESVAGANHIVPWILNQFSGRLSVETKKLIAKRVMPFLALIHDSIEQAHWVLLVSQKLTVPHQSIIKAIEKFSGPKHARQSPSNSKPKLLNVAEQLLVLFEKLPNKQIEYKDLYQTLKSWYHQDTNELLLLYDHLHGSLRGVDDEQEFQATLVRYQSEQKEALKQRFAQEIADAENSGDRQKAKELVQKLYKEFGTKPGF